MRLGRKLRAVPGAFLANAKQLHQDRGRRGGVSDVCINVRSELAPVREKHSVVEAWWLSRGVLRPKIVQTEALVLAHRNVERRQGGLELISCQQTIAITVGVLHGSGDEPPLVAEQTLRKSHFFHGGGETIFWNGRPLRGPPPKAVEGKLDLLRVHLRLYPRLPDGTSAGIVQRHASPSVEVEGVAADLVRQSK